jgi:hypothetical protein
MLEVDPLMIRQATYIMHDGFPPRLRVAALQFLDRDYPAHWVGRIEQPAWPPRSRDLNTLAAFCGTFKISRLFIPIVKRGFSQNAF